MFCIPQLLNGMDPVKIMYTYKTQTYYNVGWVDQEIVEKHIQVYILNRGKVLP